MKFTTALLAAISAKGALAAILPSPNTNDALEGASRRGRARRTQSPGYHSTPPKIITANTTAAKTHGPLSAAASSGYSPPVFVTENWSGEVVVGTGINYARGTIVVPTASIPPGDPAQPSGAPGFYDTSIWVGIDGDTCQTGLIQCGIEIQVYSDGSASYSPWWEWWPYNYETGIADLAINPGDTVRMSVWMFTPTSGQVQVENLSNNQHYQQTINVPSQYALCGETAEWIVETPTYGALGEPGSIAPLPYYTPVTFTDTYTNLGAPTAQDTQIFYLNNGTDTLSECSIPSPGAPVTCHYSG